MYNDTTLDDFTSCINVIMLFTILRLTFFPLVFLNMEYLCENNHMRHDAFVSTSALWYKQKEIQPNKLFLKKISKENTP